MPLSTGQVLNNRYRIDALLGQGGMGAVYRAWDSNLKMPVAVKVNFDASLEAQRQFEREAGILARLSHSNLPRVTDYFFIPGQGQYLVMDFVEGEDLQAMLDRLDALPESQVLTWIFQVCDALSYLHSQPSPIIHRDIKPANIKIRTDGRAMLVDFGIAKIYDPAMSTTIGARAVTPGYSPPEQYGSGITDIRSDIYALGATLYHLLTGETPPESTQRMIHATTIPLPRQLNQSISPVAERAILKAVEITTDRRFQSVEEFRAALSAQPAILRSTPMSVSRQPRIAQPPLQKRKLRRGFWLVLAGSVGLLLIAVVAGALALSGALTFNRSTPTAMVAALGTRTNAPSVTTETTSVQVSPTTVSSSLATLTPSTDASQSTPEATEPPPTHVPTSTPQPTSTPSCPTVSGPFATVWSIIQGEIGCATGSHFSIWVAEEAFENGWMYWRKDNDRIYAVYSSGSWETYTHMWHEGTPYFSCSDANTPDQSPPTPVMGFGQVWCTYPKVRQNLGWATEAEHGYDAIVQHFERGFMLQTDGGVSYVFYNSGGWERR